MEKQYSLSIYNEYGALKSVIVGPPDTLPPLVPINATQDYYYQKDPPRIEIIINEHRNFINTLEKSNVNVIWADKVKDCDQRDIRDISAVIGDKLLICRVKEEIRKNEIKGLKAFINSIDTRKIIWCTEGLLEGGDIIVNGDTLYVGIGQRTNEEGYYLLQNHFSNEFNIIPLFLKGRNSLHLDTVFNVFAEKRGIIFPYAFDNVTLETLRESFNLIEVTDFEQFTLATNFLMLNPDRVIVDIQRNPRIASELDKLGLKVTDVSFAETNKIGGSFRCATLPLCRTK